MTVLKIDIDKKDILNLFLVVKKIKKYFRNSKISIKETKKGYHLYIQTNQKLSLNESILYQAFFGSDIIRELQNIKNKRNRLFEKKYEFKNNKFCLTSEEKETFFSKIVEFIFNKVIK
ncbi:MAG: hypothetical protein QW474_02210 [Candidatus Aenigmatarchaeota archaeon]